MVSYRRLFRLFLGTDRDVVREVDEEIRSHLEMRAADLERRGLSPRAAREEAERRFGDLEEARRRLRATSRARHGRQGRRDLLASVASDVSLALRRARSAPGHTAISLATFALAIGLTTAGFTVVDRVLIRSLPFPAEDRLVALQTEDSTGSAIAYLSASIWLDWREGARTLAGSALYSSRPQRWGHAADGEAFHVEGRDVTPGFFDVLGVGMVRGRGFRPGDQDEAVVVVSERFWRGVLGAAALPVVVDLAGRRRQVVGVVPAGLEYPLGTEAYQPFEPSHRGGESYNWLNFMGVGRLAPGVSAEQAATELAGIARAAREANPQGQYIFGAAPIPLREMVVGDARSYLLLLMGAVMVLLLIACANLAGLGLARASGRAREVALRLSLGAGRVRLVRQFLTEQVVLALAGGVLGVVLAHAATGALTARAAALLPRADEIGIDARILAFAFVASLAAGALAGIVPALWAARSSLRETLGGGQNAARGGRNLPGAVLVGVEVALALVLLTGGSLLVRSFTELLERDVGYEAEGVVAADAVLGGTYPAERWDDFWVAIESRLSPRPGVAAVGFTNAVPTSAGGTGFIEVEGLADGRAGADYRVVSDDYFEVMGIALIRGRGFGSGDRAGSGRVTVVNQAMADRYWPGEDPLGKRVKAYSMEGSAGTPETAPWLTVVGVVENIRQHGHAGDQRTEMYVSMRQVPHRWHLSSMTAVARGEPGVSESALIGTVREAFRAENDRLAVEIQGLGDRLSGMLAQRRLVLTLLTGFAGLSLLLAAIGLYGLLSFAVARSRQEMGIRAALGARAAGILRLMLGRAFRVVALGAAAGLILAFWLVRILESLLVDIPPRDPASFVAALAVLLVVAGAAALVPSWRATRADPVEVLRG